MLTQIGRIVFERTDSPKQNGKKNCRLLSASFLAVGCDESKIELT
jgi:hypothetical protein